MKKIVLILIFFSSLAFGRCYNGNQTVNNSWWGAWEERSSSAHPSIWIPPISTTSNGTIMYSIWDNLSYSYGKYRYSIKQIQTHSNMPCTDYDIETDGNPCPDGQIPDISTVSCKEITCPDGEVKVNGVCEVIGEQGSCDDGKVRRDDGSCGCPGGTVENESGECCDTNGATNAYDVGESECGSLTFVKINNTLGLIGFSWNACLNTCTANEADPCDYGKVLNENGMCIDEDIDDQQCTANGGSLTNCRIVEQDSCTEISSGGQSVLRSPCCEKICDCVDGSGNVITSESIYVSCSSNITDINGSSGDSNSSDNSNLPTANTPTADNTPKVCATCSLLDDQYGGWIADEKGNCQRYTQSGVLQLRSCPTQTNQTVKPNPSTRPDTNSTFKESNATINQPGEKTPFVPCKSCPPFYKDFYGHCGEIRNGLIYSVIPCPDGDGDGTALGDGNTSDDGNGTIPGDGNSTIENNGTNEDNGSLFDEFPGEVEDAIKGAYKSYSFFNDNDCGSLILSSDAYIGDPEAVVSDPTIIIYDLLYPYQPLIKSLLMISAVVIGLFNFFKRD